MSNPLSILVDKVLTPSGDLEVLEREIRIIDGRIGSIRPFRPHPRQLTKSMDLRGMTLLPGLINAHEHIATKAAITPFDIANVFEEPFFLYLLRCARNAKALLRSGITAVRECGARRHANILIRDGINRGLAEGPRIVACGQPLGAPRGHMWQYSRPVNSLQDIPLAVQEQITAGADFIKVHASGGAGDHTGDPTTPQLSALHLEAIVRQAQLAGRAVAAHAIGTEAVANSLAASVFSLEHGYGLTARLADRMAAQGVLYVPTISGYYSALSSQPTPARPSWSLKKARHLVDGLITAVSEAVRAGVRIAAGTDSFGDLVTELILLRECGLPTSDVLAAATSNAAAVLGRESDLGAVRESMLADIIAVSGDPRSALEALREPVVVIQGGRVVVDRRYPVEGLGGERDESSSRASKT